MVVTVWWSGSLPGHFRGQRIHYWCRHSQSQTKISSLQRKQKEPDNVSTTGEWCDHLSSPVSSCSSSLLYLLLLSALELSTTACHMIEHKHRVRTLIFESFMDLKNHFIRAVHCSASLQDGMWFRTRTLLQTVKLNWKQWTRNKNDKNNIIDIWATLCVNNNQSSGSTRHQCIGCYWTKKVIELGLSIEQIHLTI